MVPPLVLLDDAATEALGPPELEPTLELGPGPVDVGPTPDPPVPVVTVVPLLAVVLPAPPTPALGDTHSALALQMSPGGQSREATTQFFLQLPFWQ
jgi:hypothetical protein